MAKIERTLADNFWDLRDDAYDHPKRWESVGVEGVFQFLAELVERQEASGSSIDWRVVRDGMIAWRQDAHTAE
jgi:hypothetical protein